MPELKVGGEVDAHCTRCKLVLAHTILAIWAGRIKRVRCNTCMGEHAFHAAEPSSSSSRAARPRPAAPIKAVASSPSSYDALLAGKDRSSARRYDAKQKFSVGDLVEHPAFGLGVVAAARGLEKIDVAFPTTAKTLLHNRGAGPALASRPPMSKVPDVELDERHQPDPAADTSDEPDEQASHG
jgi:hypothetical protein